MRDQLQARLDELKRQYQLGEGQLRELGRQEATLRETLLRITGAIQVLEELLGTSPAEAAAPATEQEPDEGATAGQNGNRGPHEVLTVP
jgi:prefoldin subunit 5